MLRRIGLLVLIVSLFQVGRTCEDNNDDRPSFRQNSYMDEPPEESANPWQLPYYYNGQTQSRMRTGIGSAERQNPENRFIFTPRVTNSRIFGSIARPFVELDSQLSAILSPRSASSFSLPYDSCSSPNGEMGICSSSKYCSQSGGRASGSCIFGYVCCINVATNCGGTVTLNNTYWQSPTTGISPSTTCALTVKLDTKLTNQPKPICQVRLNFVAFTISQPDTQSVCSTDTFDIGGANNKVPVICGDNDGQHMYLNVPPSNSNPTDLQLTFTMRAVTATRVWNILISMLPCDANYLAPPDCLQYFSTRSGTVNSFNWRDVAGTATRQLANQDYNICFRTPLGLNRRGGNLCLTPCTVITTQLPFGLSIARTVADQTVNAVGASQGISTDCNNDYLVIPGGFNTGIPNPNPPVPNMAFDRFCGNRLNANPNSAQSTTVCTAATPFRILYRTNGDETTTPTADTAVSGNRGFCLTFQL